MGVKIAQIGVQADNTSLSKSGNTLSVKDNGIDGTKIAMGSDAAGDIMYYNGTDYVRLAKGTSGQFLQQGASAPQWATGNLTKIATQTLGAAGTTLSFTSIPSGYKFFKIIFIGKKESGTSSTSLILRLNNDSGSNYTYQVISGAATTATLSQTTTTSFSLAGATTSITSSTAESTCEIEIWQNSTTRRKGIKSNCYIAGAPGYQINNGTWNNTADEISQIDLIASLNLDAGSSAILYGIL